MSALFNQTNIAPGTTFASGSGNDIFPLGLTIGGLSGGTLTPELGGGGGLVITPTANRLIINSGGDDYDNLNLSSKDITWQNIATGTTQVFATFSLTGSQAQLSNISTINGAVYAGSNFASGLTFGTSNGIMSLSSFNTTTATALLQGTPGNDPQLIIGTSNNNLNLAQDDISFFDTAVGGQVDFAAYGGGAKVLVSNLQSINGLGIVGDFGADAKATSSGNATLDGAGQANIVLTDTYRDSNSYSVLTTKLGAAATITPWVSITDSNAFTINGDAAADVSWLSIGLI